MDISEKKYLPPIRSNTLKYEYIILPQAETSRALIKSADNHFLRSSNGNLLSVQVKTEDNLKRNLCHELDKTVYSYYYSKLAEIEANHYITTNYELFINKALADKGFCLKSSCDGDNRLYRHELYECDNHLSSVWNIHGDVKTPQSIMLGLSDYCKYVVDIDKYFNSSEFESGKSWIDLFFRTNVHIVGLGMAYEEIDLWNVLTTRMRLKRSNNAICHNHIYYYAIQDESFDTGKKKLLEAMDVIVIDIAFDWSDQAYKNAYENIYLHILNLKN